MGEKNLICKFFTITHNVSNLVATFLKLENRLSDHFKYMEKLTTFLRSLTKCHKKFYKAQLQPDHLVLHASTFLINNYSAYKNSQRYYKISLWWIRPE